MYNRKTLYKPNIVNDETRVQYTSLRLLDVRVFISTNYLQGRFFSYNLSVSSTFQLFINTSVLNLTPSSKLSPTPGY